mmetsp:Transcript_64766/g.200511  ORF Transcript_64766/g.200511 Transcript_64766/m.200511 type:complete len:305 (-) Transcript_64766:383-1297(-)
MMWRLRTSLSKASIAPPRASCISTIRWWTRSSSSSWSLSFISCCQRLNSEASCKSSSYRLSTWYSFACFCLRRASSRRTEAAFCLTTASSVGTTCFFAGFGLNVHSAIRSASTFLVRSSTSVVSLGLARSKAEYLEVAYFEARRVFSSSLRRFFSASTSARLVLLRPAGTGIALTSLLMTSGSGMSRAFGCVRWKGFGDVALRFSGMHVESAPPPVTVPVALYSSSLSAGCSSPAKLCSFPMTSSSMYLTSYTLHHSILTHFSNSSLSMAYWNSANTAVTVPTPQFRKSLTSSTPSSSSLKKIK